MHKQFLSLEQNTCAARIFLNVFGLSLDDVKNINELSVIKIFDSNGNIVGNLYFDNGNVLVSVKYNGYILDAIYDISNTSYFIDGSNDLVGGWTSNIFFNVYNSYNEKLTGEFPLDCSVDFNYGVSCICRPFFMFDMPNNKNIQVRILREGQMFGSNIKNGDYNEDILFKPLDKTSGYIRHHIVEKKYCDERNSYPYRRSSGVLIDIGNKNKPDKIRGFLREDYNHTNISFLSEVLPKLDDYSSSGLIQKGELMHRIDPMIYERINYLRDVFTFGDVHILDNLFYICYDGYTDKEVMALFGFKSNKNIYQNGSNNLVESYFELNSDSNFSFSDKQKKLLKNIDLK